MLSYYLGRYSRSPVSVVGPSTSYTFDDLPKHLQNALNECQVGPEQLTQSLVAAFRLLDNRYRQKLNKKDMVLNSIISDSKVRAQIIRILGQKNAGLDELCQEAIDRSKAAEVTAQLNACNGKSYPADMQAAEEAAPAVFTCPISRHCFRDPVILPSGQTYERQDIEKWLASGNQTCPITRQRLVRPIVLTSNVALRRAIEEWAEKNAPVMMGSDGHLRTALEGDHTP